jgi:hypothetical protein
MVATLNTLHLLIVLGLIRKVTSHLQIEVEAGIGKIHRQMLQILAKTRTLLVERALRTIAQAAIVFILPAGGQERTVLLVVQENLVLLKEIEKHNLPAAKALLSKKFTRDIMG